MRLNNLL